MRLWAEAVSPIRGPVHLPHSHSSSGVQAAANAASVPNWEGTEKPGLVMSPKSPWTVPEVLVRAWAEPEEQWHWPFSALHG